MPAVYGSATICSKDKTLACMRSLYSVAKMEFKLRDGFGEIPTAVMGQRCQSSRNSCL